MGGRSGGRLNGLVAVVTGAGSVASGIGNGRAAAILFAREGANVLLVDMVRTAAEETKAIISSEGGVADLFAPCDVTSLADCEAIVEKAIGTWGRLDILVNNVGVSSSHRCSVVDLPSEEFAHVLNVNVQSMMQTSKYAIPQMIKSGGGSIINIGSFGGIYPSPGNSAYAASKGAVMALTKAMAVDHGQDNIRVNCIAPGMMATPMGLTKKGGGTETPEEREARISTESERRKNLSLLGSEGSGWDIGHAAVFLACDESRYITGITLLVDGGAALR